MQQKVYPSISERLLNTELLTPEQLTAAISAVGEDEEGLYDYLLKNGTLTRFQVRQLRAGSTSLSVGKYVVVDCLGRGGNGIVLKARHKLMRDRYVALKTIDTRSLHRSEEIAVRFHREIEILSKLDHPNVVRALDVIQTRTHLYLVLEFVAGRDLAWVVKEKGPLSVESAVDYIVQAARGLAFAHKQGIIHRDLKPTNLLLTPDNVVKISDLGLARFFEDESPAELTIKGMAIGTPEFMAPEQAEDASAAEPRSDLFSLGATLFHLLTGTLPIGGSSYLHKLKQLLTAPPVPLSDVRPDVPPGLAYVVDSLRAKNLADRPESAEEAITLLEPFLPDRSTPSRIRANPKLLADLVLQIIQGKSNVQKISSQYGLTPEELARYQDRFLEGGRKALDPSAQKKVNGNTRELHAKIGMQAMEIEELKRQLRGE